MVGGASVGAELSGRLSSGCRHHGPHITGGHTPVSYTHLTLPTIRLVYFVIRYADGHKGVRELVQRGQLKKKAHVERLELSRRYWAATDTEWMVVIVDG